MAAFYSAIITAVEITWHGRRYKFGETIVVEAADRQELQSVVADWKPVAGEIETAVIEATENASKNYRRRPR